MRNQVKKVYKWSIKVFSFGLICMLWSLTAYGTNILSVDMKKREVILTRGKNGGLELKTKVCFYSIDGDGLACGRVTRITNTRAWVRVNGKPILRLRPGQEAQYLGKDDFYIPVEELQSTINEPKNNEPKPIAKINFSLSLETTPLYDTAWSKLKYKRPIGSENTLSLWDFEEDKQACNIGISMEMGGRLPSLLNIIGGFRYGLMEDHNSEDEYNNNPELYAETQITGDHFSIYGGVLWWGNQNDFGLLQFGNTLEINITNIRINANRRNIIGGSSPLVSIRGQFQTFSLGYSIQYTIKQKWFPIKISGTALLPVGFSQQYLNGRIEANDNLDQLQGDGLENLTSVLSPKKSQLSIILSIGISLNQKENKHTKNSAANN
ncbi:MAG: hypothetical protein CMP10_10380 [Zetaproteobacteria bacterium]|nr:hypothetical protein [Pseudobdellovibrionaceae bacterium]|tara:strand:- start:1407 stop:2543 length:1137 start_codon:yes stop_codon:yes gene_type:complete